MKLSKDKSDKTKSYFGQKEYKLNKKIITFIFFLGLAFVLWLLNTLDNNFSSNISYPIRYIHHQPDKEMVGKIPTEITLNVDGHGYGILKSMLAAKANPIILRVMSLNFIKTRDTSRSYVVTRNLAESIQRQLGSELKLNYILPDTLYFSFSPVVHKKVAIEPNVKIDFEKQFMAGGDFISKPDSIIISGPQSIIDTIKKIRTILKKYTNVQKSFSEDIRLEPIEKVYYEKKQVMLIVPVEKYTESFIMIPVKTVNMPDAYDMKVFPPSIKVSYIVALRNYSHVKPNLFRAIVDYQTLNTSINNKLRVTLEKYPTFIKSVSFYPKNVDYIIETQRKRSESIINTEETESNHLNNKPLQSK